METFIQKTAAIIQLKRAGNSDLEIVKAMYQAWNIPEHRTREILEQVRDKAPETRGQGLEQYHAVVDWFPELHGERTKRLFSKDQYARLVEALEDALGYDDDSEIARKFLKQEDYESLHKIIIYHQITLRDRGALDRWLDGTGETYHDKLVVRRCQFVNGLLHGYYTVFSSGAVRSVCEFVNGKRHGGAATFYKDDSRSEAVFHEDEIVGEIEYDRNNNVTKKHFYNEGQLLLTQHFEYGKLVREERFY